MKKILLLTLLIAIASTTVYGQTCDDRLLEHVYQPNRMVVRKGCISVTGIVKSETHEADGNIKMRLQLDLGQGSDLINQANNDSQQGFLVFELLCQDRPTLTSARRACRNFKQNTPVPTVGSRVKITGRHVQDAGGWLEIHPVTSIERLISLPNLFPPSPLGPIPPDAEQPSQEFRTAIAAIITAIDQSSETLKGEAKPFLRSSDRPGPFSWKSTVNLPGMNCEVWKDFTVVCSKSGNAGPEFDGLVNFVRLSLPDWDGFKGFTMGAGSSTYFLRHGTDRRQPHLTINVRGFLGLRLEFYPPTKP